MDKLTVAHRVALSAHRRMKDAAVQALRAAKEDPLNGWATHKAVEKTAEARGYALATADILGLLLDEGTPVFEPEEPPPG